jgi:mannose-6-phosphate isomerase-like protein (cupin superfamily)
MRADYGWHAISALSRGIVIRIFVRCFFALVVCFTVGCSHGTAAGSLASAAPSSKKTTASAPIKERPLILAPNQGETREWRPLARLPSAVQKLSVFTIKVDRQNGGSPEFWFGTEVMPVGAAIQPHRHLHEDEMLYIGSGVARAHVGSLEGTAPAGSIIFVPRDTWVSINNIGKTPINLFYGFNEPSFDKFMRCESVPAGQPAPPLSAQEDQRCTKLGDVQYR